MTPYFNPLEPFLKSDSAYSGVLRNLKAGVTRRAVLRTLTQTSAGSSVSPPSGGGGGGTASPLTTVFLKDVSSVHEAIMTSGASFTIGGPTSGMDIELVYSTGPAPFEWSAADFTAGRTVVRVILPGYSGVLPFDVGAVDWSWSHSGTGDVMNRITVTKPGGHPVPADYGKFKSRIRVEIQQSA